MLKKLVSTFSVLLFFPLLFLVACAGIDASNHSGSETIYTTEPDVLYEYFTFEETLLEFATDIVIAHYVGSRSFGENLTEFEFIVSDRILGDATDRIFVYADHHLGDVVGSEQAVSYMPGDLSFERDVDYLLPLSNINSPYSAIPRDEDEFVFIRNIVIDLDEPSNSIMYSESLDER